MQQLQSGEGSGSRLVASETSDRINWTSSFYPECSGEIILTPDHVIFAAPGDFGLQGRALLTTYQLLYKAPGTLGAKTPPEAFPLMGLASVELQPELYGFMRLSLIGVHYRRLVLYMGSRKIATSLVGKIQEITSSLQISSSPAFKSPPLLHRFTWTPSEINKDWQRLGLPNQRWRLSVLNSNYKLCSSYPTELFVPAPISDAQLERAAAYREGGRFAFLCSIFSSGAVLARCSQPKAQSGSVLKARKCDEDIALLVAMMDGKHFRMLDVRPRVRSVQSTDLGMAAAEDPADYPGLSFHHLGLDSIHAAQHALTKLYAACDDQTDTNWLSALASSRWLRQVGELLAAAQDTLLLLQNGTSVIIRSADGGDEDAQLSSLVLLLYDPHYRTIAGFRTLVEREWLASGHKFATRIGLAGSDRSAGRAPVFLQFLDACYQIQHQFPMAFQFRESFLVVLARAVHTARFGNFLANSQRERTLVDVEGLTPSIWSALTSEGVHLNELYDAAFGALINVDHRLMHLTFWRNYHLRSMTDVSTFVPPQKIAVNVYAQWRELQAIEAQLMKQATIMEMRQREREAAPPEETGGTEAEKLRNRVADLQSKLERAERAARSLEKEIAATKESNKKLADECRIMRAQADPSTTLSGIALDTRVLIGVSTTSATPMSHSAYHKFYLRMLENVKELLLSSQQLVDDVSGAHESTESTRKYCTNLAYEFVETVEISPHTSTSLLQEAKAVRESLLLLVTAAEEEERGVDRAASHLQTACQLVAANVSTCIEAAAAPLKSVLPEARDTLSRLGAVSPAGGQPVNLASTQGKAGKSDEARAEEELKKVGRLTMSLRTRDVMKEIQQKKESTGSRRVAIAAAAAQATAIAREESRRKSQLTGPMDGAPPPPFEPPPLQPLLADAVGEAQNRQNALAALGAVQPPPPPDPAQPETGSRRELYLKAITAPVPKAVLVRSDSPAPGGGPGSTIKSGYLTKRGEGLRTWKRRWFILRADALAYYAVVGASSPKGSILFENGVALSPFSGKKPHCFSIITPKRTYYLAAKDEEERNAWFSVLAAVLPQTQP